MAAHVCIWLFVDTIYIHIYEGVYIYIYIYVSVVRSQRGEYTNNFTK